MERPALARLRVPLGLASAAVGMVLARPTVSSLLVGGAIAVVGEAIRVWASGHIEKGREVTRSGPYRFVRHPLYLGSAIIGIGFMIAARNVWVALLVSAYLATTLLSAMRSEEAALDAKFGGEYSAYRAGRAEPVDRPFSLARLSANREHRAIAGLALGLGLLYLRSLL
jgi:protein-S-isoprenylcysteine O-methyltransferase Ste14